MPNTMLSNNIGLVVCLVDFFYTFRPFKIGLILFLFCTLVSINYNQFTSVALLNSRGKVDKDYLTWSSFAQLLIN